MPFLRANDSHFVGALGFGSVFQRGSGVRAVAGRESVTPSGVEWMGQVERSWLTRVWAPSRARAWRVELVVVRFERRVDVGGRGFES